MNLLSVARNEEKIDPLATEDAFIAVVPDFFRSALAIL